MSTQKENVKAGLFVLMGIVLGIAILFILTDFRALTEKRQPVRVFYRLGDGLRGLKVGAQVTLGNVPVGEVVEIADFVRDGQLLGQVVMFEIPAKYEVKSNATVMLDVPTFGAGTKLNITSLGTTGTYGPDAVLDGAIATNPLAQDVMTNAGIAAQQREQVKQIIANLAAITDGLKTELPEITGGAKRVLGKVEPLIDRADVAVKDVQLILADARKMTATLQDRSAMWFERVDDITIAVQSTMNRIDNLTKDKDPIIRETAENLRELVARLNDEVAPQLAAILDDTRAVSAETRVAITGQRPVIERTLANLQLASGQLKLTMIELRRSPWRLLYRPDKAEIANDNLYDAARSFALGASALDSAAASLRVVADQPGGDEARVKAILVYLDALFARFKEAEQEFWSRMQETGP